MPDLRIFGLTLMMALALAALQAAQSAPCQLNKIATLPVSVSRANGVLVAGSIKGEPVQFEADTGTNETTFDASVISRFGLANEGQSVTGYGATGETAGIMANVPDVQIGNIKILTTSQLISRTHFLPDGVYALFGEDFFISYDLDLDLKNSVINLMAYDTCPGEPVYWSNTFSEADTPVRNGKIFVKVELDGKAATAILDTGASTSVVSWALARRIGINKDSAGVMTLGSARGIGNQALTEYGYRFSELHVGDEVVRNPFLRIFNLMPIKHDYSMAHIQDTNLGEFDVVLGADFIKTHHIYITTQQGKMYFTFNGGGRIFPAPPESPSTTAVSK
jgi:predicted aspartyl protease